MLEDAPMLVKYKWDNGDMYGDLICELTEFMDKFIITEKQIYQFYRTYLYNDIGVYSELNCLQMSFRVPRSY